MSREEIISKLVGLLLQDSDPYRAVDLAAQGADQATISQIISWSVEHGCAAAVLELVKSRQNLPQLTQEEINQHFQSILDRSQDHLWCQPECLNVGRPNQELCWQLLEKAIVAGQLDTADLFASWCGTKLSQEDIDRIIKAYIAKGDVFEAQRAAARRQGQPMLTVGEYDLLADCLISQGIFSHGDYGVFKIVSPSKLDQAIACALDRFAVDDAVVLAKYRPNNQDLTEQEWHYLYEQWPLITVKGKRLSKYTIGEVILLKAGDVSARDKFIREALRYLVAEYKNDEDSLFGVNDAYDYRVLKAMPVDLLSFYLDLLWDNGKVWEAAEIFDRFGGHAAFRQRLLDYYLDGGDIYLSLGLVARRQEASHLSDGELSRLLVGLDKRLKNPPPTEDDEFEFDD